MPLGSVNWMTLLDWSGSVCSISHIFFWGGVGQSDEWQANGRSIGGGNGATAWGKDGRGRRKDERAGATRVNPDVEEGTISKSHMIFLIKKKVYYRCG